MRKHFLKSCAVILLSLLLNNISFAGILFDRSNDYLDVGTMGNFGTGLDTNYGITSFWFKTSNTSNEMSVFGILNDGANLIYEVILNLDDDASGVVAHNIFAYRRDEDGNANGGAVESGSGVCDGNWHHLVVSIKNDGVVVWLDAVQQTFDRHFTGDADNMANFAYSMVIGARNVRSVIDFFFDGDITEVAMWSSSTQITQAEVSNLFSKVKRMPLQIKTSDLTGGYWPLNDGIDGTVATSETEAQLKTDGNCQGAWAMTANTGNETDLSGNNETLTETSGSIPTSADRKKGETSRDFDSGDTEYLLANDGGSTDINGANQDLSITAWIKRETDSGAFEQIVSKYNGGDNERQYFLAIDSADKARFQLSSDGTATASATGGTNISTGLWYHFAGVYNDTDIRVYVNGTLDSSGTNPTAYVNGINNSTAEFIVGAIKSSGVAGEWWNGLLDEVMIFDRDLSAAEVLAIYNEGVITYIDRSSNGNDGTANGDLTPKAEEVLSYPD